LKVMPKSAKGLMQINFRPVSELPASWVIPEPHGFQELDLNEKGSRAALTRLIRASVKGPASAALIGRLDLFESTHVLGPGEPRLTPARKGPCVASRPPPTAGRARSRRALSHISARQESLRPSGRPFSQHPTPGPGSSLFRRRGDYYSFNSELPAGLAGVPRLNDKPQCPRRASRDQSHAVLRCCWELARHARQRGPRPVNTAEPSDWSHRASAGKLARS
jgi:hypothetical protein